MQKSDIVTVSLKELYEKNPETGSFHDGCLIATNHNIYKQDSLQKDNPMTLFYYPCRINAIAAVVCEKGKVLFTSNLKRYVLQENTLILNMANTIVKVDEIEDSILHILAFDENFLKDIHIDIQNLVPQFLHILENPCITLLPEETADLQQIFRLIEEESRNLSGKAYEKEILHGYISVVLYKICAVLKRVKQMQETASVGTVKNRGDEYFRNFMIHLQQHYCEERSLGYYASLLHITPKYLTMLIKQVSGRSAAEWIDDFVILE
ncbi:MAG: hypothetical protein LUI04_02520, partial [Porphyromonadaceae bacterium]|nr:hypothetical protein [Porphyromonadaceae bacterium]